jgi:hypothetical protein
MANMADEELAEAIKDVQMEALADVSEDLEVQANIAQVLQMTPEQLAHVDMTREELEYFLANQHLVELEEIDCSQELSVEEILLSKADLMDLLKYNMEEVGDNIKEFDAFMNFLIENGLYQEDEVPGADIPMAEVVEVPAADVPMDEVAEAPVAEVPAAAVPAADVPMAEVPVADGPAAEVPAVEAPAAEVVADADKRKKVSILMARLNSVIKSGKKRNSNVALDEEEIEHHRKMLKTVAQVGQVLS